MALPDLESTPSFEANLNATTLLEYSLIKTYLEKKGYSLASLISLPPSLARALLIEASVYASCRMAEIESWGKIIKDLTN